MDGADVFVNDHDGASGRDVEKLPSVDASSPARPCGRDHECPEDGDLCLEDFCQPWAEFCADEPRICKNQDAACRVTCKCLIASGASALDCFDLCESLVGALGVGDCSDCDCGDTL